MDVVFDADTTEASQAVHGQEGLGLVEVHLVLVGRGQFRVVENRWHEVDARFDRETHSGFEVQVEAQVGQAELFAALAAGAVVHLVAEPLHVVHVETNQVPDTVGEEQ